MFFFQFKNSSVEGNSLSTSGLDEPVAVVDRESGRKVSILNKIIFPMSFQLLNVLAKMFDCTRVSKPVWWVLKSSGEMANKPFAF